MWVNNWQLQSKLDPMPIVVNNVNVVFYLSRISKVCLIFYCDSCIECPLAIDGAYNYSENQSP